MGLETCHFVSESPFKGLYPIEPCCELICSKWQDILFGSN